jgi:predicted phosphodiesterase
MTKNEIKSFLRQKRGYLKFGSMALAKQLNIKNVTLCSEALKEVKSELETYVPGITMMPQQSIFKNAFFDNKTSQKLQESNFIKNNKLGKKVLVIGDLHEPFCLKGYLEHCLNIYKQHNCNEVVFIGDIIDNHASSYHETNPDGHNAGAELKLAINNIQNWYNHFPKATVIIGNHDRLIMRKAQTAGLSKMWIKDYAEVLGTPGWTFTESIEIDNVLYIHGEGGTARQRARRDLQSIVQGHLHTQAYVDWVVGSKFKIFGCQVGCGIDHKTYAMTYAKEFAKPAIGCAVILNGKTVFNEMMEL